ncbi:MAG: hypothetical protein IJD54_01485 [Clostridia bacterium]|nr:hypothetical protein [Clostridia bacterium]
MGERIFLVGPNDLTPMTEEELLSLSIEELLIIAKYMRISNARDLDKQTLVETILFRERARAPYPNIDDDRYSYDPTSPAAKKYKIKKALEHIEDVLFSLID